MAGLDPAIHVLFLPLPPQKRVDARIKPEHDEVIGVFCRHGRRRATIHEFFSLLALQKNVDARVKPEHDG